MDARAGLDCKLPRRQVSSRRWAVSITACQSLQDDHQGQEQRSYLIVRNRTSVEVS